MELASILVFVVLTAATAVFFMPFLKLVFNLPSNPPDSKYPFYFFLQKFELLKSKRKMFYLYVCVFGLMFWISLSWMIYEVIGGSPSFDLFGQPGMPLRAMVLLVLAQIFIWGIFMISVMKVYDSWGIFKKYPPPAEDTSEAIRAEWRKRIDFEITQQSNDRVDHPMGCIGKAILLSLGVFVATILASYLIIIFVIRA
jgi:hypothetical protein